MNHGRHRGATAFTLIELVTVIVIFGILASVAIPAYLEHRADAKRSTEQQIVGAVRTAIYNRHAKDEITGNASWLTNLDTASPNSPASAISPFFNLVLDAPVTGDWTKGSTANTYVGPTSTTYYYDPDTGRFSTDLPLAMATQDPNAPLIADFVNQRYFTAGQDDTGKWYGTDYVANADGTVSLSLASSSWKSRAMMQAMDMPTAGDYEFDVKYRLTDYWTQLHYWQVIGIKDGTTMDLASAADTKWNLNKTGAEVIYREYSRDGQDDGQWITQNNKFTITQDMVSKYDRLLISLIASKNSGQTADWGEVTGTLPGLVPMK
jgi:prepilin-type N-terminal cleavage/methylation domain-containing protein